MEAITGGPRPFIRRWPHPRHWLSWIMSKRSPPRMSSPSLLKARMEKASISGNIQTLVAANSKRLMGWKISSGFGLGSQSFFTA